MKNNLFRVLACCVLFVGGGLLPFSYMFSNANCGIIPLPLHVEEKQNTVFELSSSTALEGESLFSYEIVFLQKEILKYKQITVAIKQRAQDSKIVFKYLAMPSEAYAIDMTSNVVTLSASDQKGMFNAIMTFMQLVKTSDIKAHKVSIACWAINDAPKHEWRGLMLDEARHFFGIARVKEILDWMASYKLNRFHWHLTDSQGWRIEIKQYPRLATMGGVGTYSNPNAPAQFYTQEEIKEIVRYAAERHIIVIPEIDMAGHAAASNKAYPEFSGGGSAAHPEYTFNPGKEGTYEYLANVLKEVDVLFPSQMIHIGGDEVHYGNEKWSEMKEIRDLIKREKLADMKAVEKYFFERMSDTIVNINNKVLAWDEVADSDLSPDNAIIFFWRHTRPEQLQKLLDKKIPVVLCPRHPMYFDYVQDTIQTYGPAWQKFSFNSLEKIYKFTQDQFTDIKYSPDDKILGFQANLWTERIQTSQRLQYMLFPRMAALSESVWCDKKEDYEGFEDRLKKHFKLYEQENIYYSNPFDRSVTGEPMK